MVWSSLKTIRAVEDRQFRGHPGAYVHVPQTAGFLEATGEFDSEQGKAVVAIQLLCANPDEPAVFIQFDQDGNGVDDDVPQPVLIAHRATAAQLADDGGRQGACELAANVWNGLEHHRGVRRVRDARGPSVVISRQIGLVYWASSSPVLAWARDESMLQRAVGMHLFCTNPDARMAYIGLDEDLDWVADSVMEMPIPERLAEP